MERKKALEMAVALRNMLRESLSEEEKVLMDKSEIEAGAEHIAKTLSKMHHSSIYCIICSMLEKNPDIILDVAKFVDELEGLYEVFGVDATAEMIHKSMPSVEDCLKKKVEKELHDKEEEKESETPDEDIPDIVKFLKDNGIDFEIVELGEEKDD